MDTFHGTTILSVRRGPLVALADHLAHGPLVQGQPARGDGDQRQRQRQDDEEQQLDGQVADAAHASGAASSPRAMARVTASVRVAAWSLP